MQTQPIKRLNKSMSSRIERLLSNGGGVDFHKAPGERGCHRNDDPNDDLDKSLLTDVV